MRIDLRPEPRVQHVVPVADHRTRPLHSRAPVCEPRSGARGSYVARVAVSWRRDAPAPPRLSLGAAHPSARGAASPVLSWT
eukprot:scaffold631_cov378-Prasinococcus_capsulatus_cf.AAC.25